MKGILSKLLLLWVFFFGFLPHNLARQTKGISERQVVLVDSIRKVASITNYCYISQETFDFENAVSGSEIPKLPYLPFQAYSEFHPRKFYTGYFLLENHSRVHKEWVLDLGNFGEAELLVINSVGSNKSGVVDYLQSGSYTPYSRKSIRTGTVLYPQNQVQLKLEYNIPYTVFFRFRNPDHTVPHPKMTLVEAETWKHDQQGEAAYKNLVFGILCGILLIMIIYHFIFYLFLSNRLYLYYVAYLFFYLLLLLNSENAFSFFTGNHPKSVIYIQSIAVFCHSLAFYLFLRRVSSVHLKLPRLDVGIKIMIGFMALTIISELILFATVGHLPLFLSIHLYVALADSVFVIFLVINFYIRLKEIQINLFLIGTFFYQLIFLPTTLYLLVGQGDPLSLFSDFDIRLLLHVGFLVEISLFAMGLANHVRLEVREKQEARDLLIEQLRSEEYMQEKNKRELEKKVKQRTYELAEKNEEIQVQSEELREAYEQIHVMNQHLEDLVTKRTEELRRAKQELDMFLYRSSHDFRRPVAALKGLVDLSEHSKQNTVESLQDLLSRVDHTAHSMDKMLTKLLMVSYTTDEHLRYDKISVPRIARLVNQYFKKTLDQEGIDFEIDSPKKVFVYSNDTLLHAIIFNLLENAVMYRTLDQKSKIRIIIKDVESDCIIEVQDNGCGISTDYHKKVFEMYVRANERSQGNGLGLYVVKKAVDRLGGEVFLESEKEVGTMVSIRFPSKKKKLEELEQKTKSTT